MNVFDDMGNYWAEISDKNQTERQIQFLKSHLKPEGYILDLACGTGRHTIPLSSVGYQMVGLDISAKLLRIAKQRKKDSEVVLADMRFLPFKTRLFAAAVSMDTSLGYLPSEKDDELSLREVKRVLRKGGSLIVDVFNRTNLAAKYRGKPPTSKSKEYPGFFLEQTRTVSDSGDWLCDSWTIRDKPDGQIRTFEHTVRLYKLRRLEGLLAAAGFVVKRVFGDYEDQEYSEGSSRLIFLACAS